MQKSVYRFVILASVVVFAAVTTGCARESNGDRSASSILGPSSLDAKGGKHGGGGTTSGGSGSLTLVMVTDNNADGAPNWGDQITFTVSTTATTEPNVSVTCSQNGSVVYSAATGYYDAYPWQGTQIMTLRSDVWTGGSASCTARLYYFSGTNTINLTSISFTAGA
jgi:hypothetical protein